MSWKTLTGKVKKDFIGELHREKVLLEAKEENRGLARDLEKIFSKVREEMAKKEIELPPDPLLVVTDDIAKVERKILESMRAWEKRPSQLKIIDPLGVCWMIADLIIIILSFKKENATDKKLWRAVSAHELYHSHHLEVGDMRLRGGIVQNFGIQSPDLATIVHNIAQLIEECQTDVKVAQNFDKEFVHSLQVMLKDFGAKPPTNLLGVLLTSISYHLKVLTPLEKAGLEADEFKKMYGEWERHLPESVVAELVFVKKVCQNVQYPLKDEWKLHLMSTACRSYLRMLTALVQEFGETDARQVLEKIRRKDFWKKVAEQEAKKTSDESS